MSVIPTVFFSLICKNEFAFELTYKPLIFSIFLIHKLLAVTEFEIFEKLLVSMKQVEAMLRVEGLNKEKEFKSSTNWLQEYRLPA